MITSSLDLERPLGPEEAAFVRAALARSFTLEHFAVGAGSLDAGVADAVTAEVLGAAMRRALAASRRAGPDTLFRHAPPGPPQRDPQPELERRGDVQPLGRGTFAYAGQFLAVRNAVRDVAARVAAGLGAQPVEAPPLWPAAVLRDMNYLHDFPHLVMVAGGLRDDHAVRARFSERNRRGTASSTLNCEATEDLAPLGSVLPPTVCACCYAMLRGRTDVADRVLTVTGPVFRNEASDEGRLDRLTAFSVTDVVLIGGEDFVAAGRERLVAAMREVLLALDLACSLESADDPFFSNEAVTKTLYQHMARLKYEARAELFGGRTMAVGSINLHQDYFSRAFDYRAIDGERPHSACVGFGLERLAYALFCRHGADGGAWPDGVRAYLRLS